MALKLSSTKQQTIVGLDIESGSISAVEVTTNGDTSLGRTGIAPLADGITRDGEINDPEGLATVLRELFAHDGLPKEVRVGIANQRVVVRTVRLPLIEKDSELETAIRFQAQDHIPMPLDQAVMDYRVIEKGVGEGGKQMDVVVVAARREMVTSLARCMREAGLRPVGIDVSAFGMIRALADETAAPQGGNVPSYEERLQAVQEGAEPPRAHIPAYLYCNLGDVTNLAVARHRDCLFTRVSSFGIQAIAQRLAERRGLTLEHARQWVAHVGLERPIETIEGDPQVVSAAREAFAQGVSKLADELRLSLEFYGSLEGAVNVEGIVACGPGSAIDGLAERLGRELGYSISVARPRALTHMDDPMAARLTLPYGLALER